MLYIFAGFPKCGLHAGGIRLLTELEDIGLLEEAPTVQYRKEGVYVREEWAYPIEVRLSDQCGRDGIDWGWFPENAAFGNGVTIHKMTAEYQDTIVLHYQEDGTVTWEKAVEDRSAYEARWAPGRCPQMSHIVHLTWLIFKHKLPEFAYERLRAIIEDGTEPLAPLAYETRDEPGKYKSETRRLIFNKKNSNAIPSL